MSGREDRPRPHPWRKQVEANIFQHHRGWWSRAYEAAGPAGRERWHHFFGWEKLDSYRVAALFKEVYGQALPELTHTKHLLFQVLRRRP